MKMTPAREIRKDARKTKKYRGLAEFKARRTFSPSIQRPVLPEAEEKGKKGKRTAKVLTPTGKEPAVIKRFLGQPKARLQARARELEVIDVAPREIITFGSVKALEAYRRDLYQVNGQKAAHFRTSRRGLTLTIWRDE
jgi:hypothetical protein